MSLGMGFRYLLSTLEEVKIRMRATYGIGISELKSKYTNVEGRTTVVQLVDQEGHLVEHHRRAFCVDLVEHLRQPG